MRIAVFHNLPSGGGKRALFEWVQRLSKRHEIDAYTFDGADHDFCDIRPFSHRHQTYRFSPRPTFGSPFGRLNRVQAWRDFNDLVALGGRIAKDIDTVGYDVVFANTCRYTTIPTLLQSTHTPSLCYLHEPFGRTFARPFDRPYERGRKWRPYLDRLDPFIGLLDRRLDAIQSSCVRRTTTMLANSDFTGNQIRNDFGTETSVSRLGVSADGFRPLANVAKRDFVVSVGELSPRKGFDFVIESLGRIAPEKRPALVLVCNRRYPREQGYINRVHRMEQAYIEDLAARRGVRLTIMSNLNVTELAEQYNAAKLCVYAPVLEPFGLVPLEAMACGTPVVGVREGGVQESVVHGRTGLLADRDPALFAEAVEELLDHPEKAREMGINGREAVLRDWSWDRSTASLESHLIECAQRKHQ